jgi:membrane protease YdiL (CAAX protease family)
MPVVVLWRFWSRDPLFGPQRDRAVPWSGAEVLSVFVAYLFWQFLWFGVVQGLAQSLGRPKDPSVNLWAPIPIVLSELVTIAILLRSARDARPYQLGLTGHRLLPNLAAGSLFWMVATPVVLAIHLLASWCFAQAGGEIKKHALEEAFEQRATVGMGLLVFLVGCILAPVLEEVLYRGVLQRWLVRSFLGRLTVQLIAFALGLFLSFAQDRGLGPACFVVVVILGCYYAEWAAWRWLPQHHVAPAICTSALLFAISHQAWPDAIALFVLAVALGFLAYRTQSLIGPITVHALFNGVACVSLFLTQLSKPAEPPKGNDTTSAIRRPVSAAISNVVPGS